MSLKEMAETSEGPKEDEEEEEERGERNEDGRKEDWTNKQNGSMRNRKRFWRPRSPNPEDTLRVVLEEVEEEDDMTFLFVALCSNCTDESICGQ